MGLRFHKSISLFKGVKLNLSKSGVGVSLGTKGARYSINTNGKRQATFGIPGTGLSYVKSFSSGKKKKSTSEAKTKNDEIQKKKTALAQSTADEKEKLLHENELKAEEAANYIDVIKSVHKECDEDTDWNAILNTAPPFVKGQKGPRETEAEKALSAYKPGLADRLFNKDDAKRDELTNSVAEARKADEQDFSDWQESHKLAQRVIDGDIDAYYEAIKEADPFDDLLDFGSEFEFGTDDPSIMEVEFCVKSDNVIPTTTVTQLKSGKLSEKEISKSAYNELLQDYICSCAIRVARDTFALLPVGGVVIHAVDKVLDTSTGNDEEVTVVSVLFEREKFEKTNFDRIDPSDFVNSFECNMKFTKTSGFKPVKRLGE
ncbi:MAG: DUF4236 domain-containing protein [Ruminiclostridium sp.]|nr:DUF4236 domain-containing protein [Ruminiclostridium sp.]